MRNPSGLTHSSVFAGLLLAAFNASAIPVLDQSFEEQISGTGGGQGIAQTFTVGVTGTLTRLDIVVQQLTGVSLGILATVNGTPTPFSTALGVVSLPDVPADSVGDWLSVDLTPLNLSVTAGDVLAWAVLGGQAQVKGNDFLIPGDRYTGGAAFGNRRVRLSPPGTFPPVFSAPGEVWGPSSNEFFTLDQAFRTYVEPIAVREPPAFALVVLGVLTFFRRQRAAIQSANSGDLTKPA